MERETIGDYSETSYVFRYPWQIKKRFEAEFLKKIDDLISKEMGGWLSVRAKKDSSDFVRWY